MKYYTYILYSESIDKYYIGYSENTIKRLEFHNSDMNNIWSKRGQPWVLKCNLAFATKTEALKAERYNKNKKSRVYYSKNTLYKKLFSQIRINHISKIS